MPIAVVNRPIAFDFVQPDNEIIAVSEKSPIIKATIPIILGMSKSAATTFFIYPPGVVIIEICTIAKTAIRKQAADKVADIKIRLVN